MGKAARRLTRALVISITIGRKTEHGKWLRIEAH